ncbi:LPXTG cell wall anchor domain-containing protein [Streptococcus suis]|uniref:LPXTG-motif cell wall anchor domain-containing protein n=1 Tax=Streptococcus suis TaxID=1307 RepID=A0A0Z8HJM7_STRSU|nr:LPXTG cell wall anchor domain-containing protein [Streptococcus suis]NQH27682.1 LPXTG cell wall anchor domain-containing protein [Streptococcus suis]NQH32178.1 LPXTG cell wall anchor domain-containing protein [Streptococcus suis]NQH48944.1 LPXTG cell wall anchor domain-containing protein [Streptococcus suis]NQP01774.1 LPXTG cell wall anchor domain-containing protein [Streptococcus suis]NQP30352.1 LPXTG cell wall anchor domain-containing protein [Streptococcus suis]
MSKQKVISGLLLSTTVLGGLLLYPTSLAKAEGTELTEVAVTEAPKSNGEEIPVTSENSPSPVLEEAVMVTDSNPSTNAESSLKEEEDKKENVDLELVSNEELVSLSESKNVVEGEEKEDSTLKVEDGPLLQATNRSSFFGDQEYFKKSVSINQVSEGINNTEITWKVEFDTEKWSFDHHSGGVYFIIPQGLKLTRIVEETKSSENLLEQFPKKVNYPENGEGNPFRIFSKKEEPLNLERSFNSQWGWSAGKVGSTEMEKWKENFSDIYFIDSIKGTGKINYQLTAKVNVDLQSTFPFIAVMKSFRYDTVTAAGRIFNVKGTGKTSESNTIAKPALPRVEFIFQEGGNGALDIGATHRIDKGGFSEEGITGETFGEFFKRVGANERVVPAPGYTFVGWAFARNPDEVIDLELKISNDLPLLLVPVMTKQPQPETPKVPSIPEKPMVDPKVSETEKPDTPEQPEVPAPSPSPESPKKEDMAPNKTKDEIYEPIVQTDKWVVYPVGTSKEEAEKKILDAVTVPKEAGETKKEIVGDVPLAAGQYGVNVKVIYDDKSYDVTLVDVHVTSNQTDKQNEDMSQSSEQPPMSEMPKVEPKVEEMKPEVMPEIPEQPREPKGPEMPSPAPEQPKTPEVPDMSQPEVPKSETPKMEQPEVVPPTPAPEQPRVPEMSETPAPSPAPESPKKEEMVPNKTKDELYEPIISMVDWVAYPVGTSKEVAEKKILDAVTVPREAGPVTKEVVGEVPLVEGQYGVNVKVIYDDHSYDIALVDVRVTNEKSHMDMPQPEAPKKETPKQEQPEMVIPEEKMPKADNPKQDTPKLEQPKVEIPKEEAPKKEIPQTETPKIEVPKESEKEKSDIQKMAKPKQEDQMAKESQKTDNPSEKMKPKSQGAKTTAPAVKQPMAEMSDGKKPQKSKETLPNTGEAGGSLTWLGAALVTLSTFVYVFKNKKKEE